MSKLIAVRLPDGLHENLSKNAEQTGQTISQLVIQGLEMVLFNTAPVGKATMTELAQDMRIFARRVEPIAFDPNLVGIVPMVNISREELQDMYPPAERPKHAETCKCLICKPPKP